MSATPHVQSLYVQETPKHLLPLPAPKNLPESAYQEDSFILNLNANQFSIFQLNFHNRKDTTLSVLNAEQKNLVLLFQEPWVYHDTFLPPPHKAWDLYIPKANPKTREEKPRTCEYVKKLIPTHSITHSPTLIAIDLNLHNPLWNPPSYRHSHPEAKKLLKIMEGKRFHLSSPLGIPTFLGNHGSATTIDHLWSNPKAKNSITLTHIQLNNHASDHQLIETNISQLERPAK
ncbi:hypothetical protein O181_053807 [Austropuccinia psidii MF-1]|uniref:Endonuclease/exonuclease/phosphatase domain-containing protein n=1 Tax=Austropuccinia psidii MF-1 TaxID=1389203 RepID=A0A9Q3HRV8_9BASI|nr:hypothetical protein [Austropuccinia psidii MF-1]